MKVSEKIKRLRCEAGLTQDELAKRLYVSRQAVTSWESGRTKPDIKSLSLISELFNVPLKYFIDEDIDLDNDYDIAREDNNTSGPKKGFIMPLITSLIFLALLSTIIIATNYILGSNKNASNPEPKLIGSYIGLDSDIEISSPLELKDYDIPYLYVYNDELFTNLMVLEDEGFHAYIPNNAYSHYKGFIYYDANLDKYEISVIDIGDAASINTFAKVLDYNITYSFIEPYRAIEISSYDEADTLISLESFSIADDGSLLDGNKNKLDCSYLDTYYISGAKKYVVRLGDLNGYWDIYNINEKKELLTNLGLSGVKIKRLPVIKFIVD